jgi:ribosomal protein S27E
MTFRKPLENTPIPDGKQGEYIRKKTKDENGVHHVEYGYCPECFCNTYIYDKHRGESVCPVCGLVIQDTTYSTPVQGTLHPDHTDLNRYTPSEKEYIRRQKLHLKERVGGTGTRYALAYRITSMYAVRLNIFGVDKQNIISFITNENLSTLQVSMEKIILSIMKYLISPRKYQDKRINRGVFREANLTTAEYKRVIKFLFHQDDGKYGIVREEDRTKPYYQWVYE